MQFGSIDILNSRALAECDNVLLLPWVKFIAPGQGNLVFVSRESVWCWIWCQITLVSPCRYDGRLLS